MAGQKVNDARGEPRLLRRTATTTYSGATLPPPPPSSIASSGAPTHSPSRRAPLRAPPPSHLLLGTPPPLPSPATHPASRSGVVHPLGLGKFTAAGKCRRRAVICNFLSFLAFVTCRCFDATS
ncbi:hypothetical protein VPH35_045804 [Triticum aestivum]